MRKIKLAIIGAGTAGLAARREASTHTDDYLVIDDGELGTTCARVGCMPSKVLIQIADDYHRRYVLPQMGIEGIQALKLNDAKALQHVRDLRDRFANSVLSDMQAWSDKHLIRKTARFIDKQTLDVGGERIEAESIIIASGSAPVIPKAWLEWRSMLVDTNQIFEWRSLPRSIGLIGLGVVGLELGQALHRLGVEVVGFGTNRALGGLSDPELQNYSWDVINREFPLHETSIEKLQHDGDRLRLETAEGLQFTFDKALVAVGRSPRVKSLGLETLNIPLDEKGVPVFDPHTMQIPDTSIFIAGDADGHRPILHEAADEGRIAGFNALQTNVEYFQRRLPLTIVFCSPQIALVGQSHQQLRKDGVDFVTGSQSFERQGRAIVKHMDLGRIHIYAERKTGTLVGAEMFCPAAEHLAHLLAWSMSAGLSVGTLLSFPVYHPVLEEGLRSALRQAADKLAVKPDVKELFRCHDAPAG